MLVLETHFLNFAKLSWCKEETIIKVVELCVMVPLMQQNFSSYQYWLSSRYQPLCVFSPLLESINFDASRVHKNTFKF